jgi:hypothetical protein
LEAIFVSDAIPFYLHPQGPILQKVSKNLVGVAGEYYVCAELCRQGILALITPKIILSTTSLLLILLVAVGFNPSQNNVIAKQARLAIEQRYLHQTR